MSHPPVAGGLVANRRFPQLDTLRAFAVTCVLLWHFSPTLGGHPLGLGPLGVRLFFVLSGFLIAGILLRGRDVWRAGGTAGRREARRFYVRRALRILPAFYALLLVSAVLNIEPFRKTFGWHATYLTNFLVAREGQWIGPASHLWSLAVEEQFYLLWPWLVWTLPERWLPFFFSVACAMGPASRAVLLVATSNDITVHAFTLSCFDFFGTGSLLAWAWLRWGEADPKLRRLEKIALLLLPLALVWPWLVGTDSFTTVILPMVQAVAFAGLVGACAHGIGGGVGLVLLWRPLLWLGQISYGVYLWHNHAPWLGSRLLARLNADGRNHFESEIAQVVYYSCLTMIMAATSWYLLERPINRWKETRMSAAL